MEGTVAYYSCDLGNLIRKQITLFALLSPFCKLFDRQKSLSYSLETNEGRDWTEADKPLLSKKLKRELVLILISQRGHRCCTCYHSQSCRRGLRRGALLTFKTTSALKSLSQLGLPLSASPSALFLPFHSAVSVFTPQLSRKLCVLEPLVIMEVTQETTSKLRAAVDEEIQAREPALQDLQYQDRCLNQTLLPSNSKCQ